MNLSAPSPFSLSEIWWKGIIHALDRNGAITSLNKKGGEILGFLPKEVAGISWFDLFLPEKERERVKLVFFQMMAGQDEALRITANLNGAALGYWKMLCLLLWNPEGKVSIQRSVLPGYGHGKYQKTKNLGFVHRIW